MVALGYHDVAPAEEQDRCGFPGELARRYKLEPEQFESHLCALEHTGLHVGLIEARSRPEVALTFDDGGAGSLDVAEALERHGWRGHFFITTSLIGEPGFLDRDGVRELARRGHVVGSHSHTHPTYMGRLTFADLQKEWGDSQQLLADVLGGPVPLASVPGGYLARKVVDSAARTGYRALLTSEPTLRVDRRGPMEVIGRYSILSNTPAETAAAYALGRYAPRTRRALEWNAKKVAKGLSPSAYEMLRRIRARQPNRRVLR